MTTLLKADAHGVVDAVEDRALLLKQHLREAEADLNRKRARLEALQSEEKTLQEASKRFAEERKRGDEDVALALGGDKEELARFAIKRLLALGRRMEHVERRAKRVKEEQKELHATLERQEQDLEELRARVKSFLLRAQADESELPLLDPVVEEEEIEIELLRRKTATAKGER
jgi:phage shock protein A